MCAARCVVEGVGGVSRLRAIAGAPCTLQLLCRDADGKDVAATSGETFRASLVGKALLDSGGGSGGSGGGGRRWWRGRPVEVGGGGGDGSP